MHDSSHAPVRRNDRARPRRRGTRPSLEHLEGRQLLAADFQQPLAVLLNGGAGNFVTDGVRASAVDSAGNTYLTGGFSGTVDFDPGPGVVNLTSAGDLDIFVAKYSPSGQLIYARRAGGGNVDTGRAIAVDDAGNAYVTGSFVGTVDFNPGAGTTNLTSAGIDPFVWKLDAAGNLSYARHIVGTTQRPATGQAIAVDPSGGVYVAGEFTGAGTLTFATNPQTVLSAPGANQRDVFVTRLNAAGNFTWAKQFTGSAGALNEVQGLAADATGVYATGNFAGTVDFNPNAGTTNLTSLGGQDAFLTKLDTSGNLVYARQFGGPDYQTGARVVVDGAQAAYLTGTFSGTIDLDPGAGSNPASRPLGVLGQFLVKVNSGGNHVWSRELGTSLDFNNPATGAVYGPGGIGLDAAGNVYVAGSYTGTAVFGPVAIPSFEASQDAFVAKYGPAGNFVDVARIGGPFRDLAYGLSVAPNGTATLAGTYVSVGGRPVAIGGYTAGLGGLPAAPNSAIYMAKLRLGLPPQGAQLADFDGNGTTDLVLNTIANNQWDMRLKAPNGNTIGTRSQQFGFNDGGLTELVDTPISGDYDGNGTTDMGVFRGPNAEWIVQLKNSGGTTIGFMPRPGWTPGDPDTYPRYGAPGAFIGENFVDLPMPGDYDGNGVTDMALYRVTEGQWLIQLRDVVRDANGNAVRDPATGQFTFVNIGTRTPVFGTPNSPNELPVPGDYNGDGVTDLAIYNISNGEWRIQFRDASGGNIAVMGPGGTLQSVRTESYGYAANPPNELKFIPIPGDYNGDGVTDLGLFDSQTNTWHMRLKNAQGQTIGTRSEQFGTLNNFRQVPVNAPFPALIRLGILTPGGGGGGLAANGFGGGGGGDVTMTVSGATRGASAATSTPDTTVPLTTTPAETTASLWSVGRRAQWTVGRGQWAVKR